MIDARHSNPPAAQASLRSRDTASAFSAPSLDSVTTIRADGSRRFLYPADARGRFTRVRRATAAALILIYFSLPWIKVGGYPAVFLDVSSLRFHLFGFTLAAQDLWLLFFLISGLGFSLFFVTSLLGRVWCGWACPQTVFLEHVYRRVERWIEGDALRRRALAQAPLTADKIVRRVLKHVIYILLSAAIAHLFISYFVSLPQLWRMMGSAPGQHWSLFVFVAVATGVLYFNFAWFREQLCIVICPYGRLQSALIDDHSLVIGYDQKRGEPRGRVGTVNAGACVDCNRCVQVCPTGIDIRQGLQVECIGCAACIDACDDVMTKLKRPRGLIRYDSLNGLAGKATRWLRPRTVLYAVLLLVGAGVSTWALSSVRPASFVVTRMQGAPYFVDPAYVRNQFLVRLVNKKPEPVRFVLVWDALPAGSVAKGFEGAIEVPALGEDMRPLVVEVPRKSYAGNFKLGLHVRDAASGYDLRRDVQFLGPDVELLREDEEASAHDK